jgi:hypothetical protein
LGLGRFGAFFGASFGRRVNSVVNTMVNFLVHFQVICFVGFPVVLMWKIDTDKIHHQIRRAPGGSTQKQIHHEIHRAILAVHKRTINKSTGQFGGKNISTPKCTGHVGGKNQSTRKNSGHFGGEKQIHQRIHRPFCWWKINIQQ